MQDLDFFDLIYQQWAKTTGGESDYWIVEDVEGMPPKHYRFGIFVVNAQDPDDRKLVASGLREEDADFIAGLHGCLGDLIRKLREAVDESDRLDYRHDSQECRIAELEMEADEYREVISSLSEQLDEATR